MHLAAVGGQSVVLDVQNDRYIGLGADLTKAALHLLEPGDTPIGDKALDHARDRLVARGILTDQGQALAAPERAAQPRTTLWPALAVPERAERTRWTGVPSALWALTEAQAALSSLPFHKIIRWLEREKTRAARREGDLTAQQLIDVFALARPWFPVKPICRLDAVALCLLFWRQGRSAQLVFGVRLEPFYAHCWAQEDEIALNESDDSLRQYAPILVI
ncbi:lasso peptide biosynthesis B2 protein [Caulobacter sp. RL271]|uniref:Lasso peptide biosynthesis B2 protein n=1 Tax=Caulobacter segnis TaxID=88688 RepID=A0ABY4ZRR4_9CAUL|nr:lasso peptide biosynthesis B2 protein [Caulobacter segnis]USQ95293.1 lasso peptide biosynthesis B2 protein [Caulobacter segnis]